MSVESPEKRLPLWAVGTLERPALWLSRVLLDGLCFLVGRENSEDCLLLQENPAVVLFPVSLEPAWGWGGVGGQVHVCTGQATGKQCQEGGQGGGGGSFLSSMAPFSRGTRIHPPAIVHTQGGMEMDVCAMVHIRPLPATDQVCVCVWQEGGGTLLLRP